MESDLQVLAFGSCRKQRRVQPVWPSIARLKPDAFCWTGDYVYGKSPAAPDELSSYFLEAARTEALLRSSVPVIDGVYDDHDYGVNDGGMRFAHRDFARTLFLDKVVNAPADSPRRTQQGGLYGVRTFGLPPRQVKLIMLDTRYAREDYVIPGPGGSAWLPKPGYLAGMLRALCATLGIGRDHAGDMLGSEDQWRWLHAQLANSTAAAHLIVSSVQVLTSSPIVESWGHFPRSRRRLLGMLAETRPAGAILLSGDVHFAEFLGLRTEPTPAPGEASSAPSASLPVGAGLLEVTSSGLTHSCADSTVGELMCGSVLRLFSGHRYVPLTDALPVGDALPTGVAPPAQRPYASPGASVGAVNFGSIGFRWVPALAGEAAALGEAASRAAGTADATGVSAAAAHLLVRIHDVEGSVRLAHRLPLGLPSDVEAARWQRALEEMPTIFEGAAVLRAPLALAVVAAMLIAIRLCSCCRAQIGRWAAHNGGWRAVKTD